MTTCQPAASMASTQATPTSVWKWLLKVSGHSTTLAAVGIASAAALPEPLLQRDRRELRDLALDRHPGGELRDSGQAGGHG